MSVTSEIIYLGELRTRAIHLSSGQEIVTDAPTDNNGRGEAFSPTDLVATALGSCMLTVMGIKARDKGWNLDGSYLSVTKVMASGPRRICEVTLHLHMHGMEVDEDGRQLLEQVALHCPVAKSVHPDMLQRVQFEWLDAKIPEAGDQ